MKKVKGVILLLIGVVLGIFLYENWVVAPSFRLFGRDLVQVQVSVIILACFALGFITGALSFLAWARRRQRNAAAASQEEQAPEPQQTAQKQEDQK